MKIGDRVRLASVMHNDPDPIPRGTTGTVDYVGPMLRDERNRPYWQVGVKWDNGRGLIAVLPYDRLDMVD